MKNAAKRLVDYMPRDKEPAKHLQVKMPASLHSKFMKALDDNENTAQDVFLAAIKMYLAEKGQSHE